MSDEHPIETTRADGRYRWQVGGCGVSGSTSAFQAEGAGSNPVTRSDTFQIRKGDPDALMEEYRELVEHPIVRRLDTVRLILQRIGRLPDPTRSVWMVHGLDGPGELFLGVYATEEEATRALAENSIWPLSPEITEATIGQWRGW